MRFVKVRSIDNLAVLMHNKVHEMLERQRTQILNDLRGNLAEIGIITAQGRVYITRGPFRRGSRGGAYTKLR